MQNFGIDNYLAFLLAGILLNITPGTDTIYILTRSIAQGRNAGILSVLGISTGSIIHTIFAAFGLSVILSTSAILFSVIKFIGAGYLIYLGIKMFIQSKSSWTDPQQQIVGRNKIFRQGVITNVLNPKVALFFLSFLPQFINPSVAQGPAPFLILGLTFIFTGTIWCLILAFGASYFNKFFSKNVSANKWMKRINGSIFIGLGVHVAMQKS